MMISFADFKCANLTLSSRDLAKFQGQLCCVGSGILKPFFHQPCPNFGSHSALSLSLLFSFQDGNVKNSNVATESRMCESSEAAAESPVNGGGLDILSLPEVRLSSAVPFIHCVLQYKPFTGPVTP